MLNFSGLIIGAITIAIIGVFHPIVIWAEYHFSKKIWPIFAIIGSGFIVASVFCADMLLSSIFAVAAAGSLWSIHELFKQEKRVKKGWFPQNPKRK